MPFFRHNDSGEVLEISSDARKLRYQNLEGGDDGVFVRYDKRGRITEGDVLSEGKLQSYPLVVRRDPKKFDEPAISRKQAYSMSTPDIDPYTPPDDVDGIGPALQGRIRDFCNERDIADFEGLLEYEEEAIGSIKGLGPQTFNALHTYEVLL